MTNITVFRNEHTISARIAEIIAKLPKGHTRAEAFRAINRAKIVDKYGELIKPSLWYDMLAYNLNPNGRTYMSEEYPDWVPTPSPYQRFKLKAEMAPKVREKITINKSELDKMLNMIDDLTEKVKSFSVKDNAIHATIHRNDTTGQKSVVRRKP